MSLNPTAVIVLLCYLCMPSAYADPCQKQNWKLSKLEFSPSDPNLVTVLGFSYGPRVKEFIPKLSGAISRFYYEGGYENSKFTFFSTYYATKPDADAAYAHMKVQVKGGRLQSVEQKDKQIIWYAGRQISDECFKEMEKIESKKL